MDFAINFSDRDEFQRQSIASNIIKLIDSEIDISPLVIDGAWGTGKTEFSLKLKSLILNEMDAHVIYIDAFKSDHTDAPIINIAAAIYSLIPEKDKKTFLEKSLPALKFGLKTTLKASSAWILKQDSENIAEEFSNALKEISDKSIEKTIENLLEEHSKHEENIKALKEFLKKISKDKKIIIIVDELDRCRPSYAVSFFESIKHIFETDNVYFILVANMGQIRASIRHAYGNAVDSKKYLDKFIKYTIPLPHEFYDSNEKIRITSVLHWINNVKTSKSTSKCDFLATFPIIDLIEQSRLSLREIESLLRYLEVYQTVTRRPLINHGVYDFVSWSVFMGIFMHCFCDRETIDNFPSEASIKVMAGKLGIKSLNRLRLDSTRPQIINITFLLYIKQFGYTDDTFYNPIVLEDKVKIFLDDQQINFHHACRQVVNTIEATLKTLSFL
ncbi:P-loop NTPase fold protein [Enterobacter sp. R4-368]|uniref:KAP family P-loop NTPase fold protein n=1 Tax=Enterobacter sp. R4-368 TaxID=1166130 RepID=UPI00034EDFB4|nr:P-loop NTPase fold protein [Enterobacter sp. R4-368]AGN84929.1 hypothetical protein H650_06920 [Enterobacter sp. R4-368]